MESKPTILILGKLPPPIIGPAIATNIILNSRLKEQFNLVHFDTRINAEVATMGKWSFAKLFKSFELYRKYKAVIKKEQPELILVPISQTTMGFVKDAPFIRIGAKYAKVVVQLRGSNFKNWLAASGSFTNSFVKKTLKKCAGVIVLGNNLTHLFEAYFTAEQIFVVPNGGNYELQTKKETELTILYLANFLPSKSFDDVLKALVILKEKGITNFKMNAAGAWDNETFKQQCLTIIADNQLDNVTLFKPQAGEAKMQLFADADVFVFCPKMPEGHPWVIVEAMANGLPVIATDQGAIIESVIDGENGFIVPAEQPLVIAEKLEQLIKDAALRKQFSEQSKTVYQTNFTEEKMVENLKGVFDAVLEGDFV
ncbi:MAG: glycosyltransferase [Flavobacteriales bacterium]|nr:glycosyltransferase [Flavobacteriales bacterium]